jgi:uncharacterized protein YydD (DUF2326 family)
MIRKIESSLPTFKTLTFHEGLNILVSDTHPDSSDKKTRNSAGKTSFVEIVHFILGANCPPGSIFRQSEIVDHTFRASLLIASEEFVVERSGGNPSRIFILEGVHSGTIKTKQDKSGRHFLPTDTWKEFLGARMFGLPADPSITDFDEPYSPSFRSMISYFARRESSKGYIDEQRQAEKQQRWDCQVNLSYLFALDWRIARDFQKIRLREGRLSELKGVVKEGDFGQMFGTVAELRPLLTVAEHKTLKLRKALDGFEVLESYKDLTSRAARARTELQAVGRERISLHETLNHLSAALDSEVPANQEDLEKMYAEAGVQLPEVALRRFDEVQAFHQSVINNRRIHLQNEITDAAAKLAATERRMTALSNERRAILASLEGKGALEDFLTMQRELAEAEAQAAILREKFAAAEILEGESTQLIEDRAALRRRLQLDHQERKAAIDRAIVSVSEVINELYDDRSGRFVVDATNNGPEFDISIAGDRGGGISKMEIFCFDIVLLGLVSARLGGPGFLIHDSHLFDGVDERQIATALSIGAREAKSSGCQYIVTMNSDVLTSLPLAEPELCEAAILPTRLSDTDDTGGLFGFRFD